MLAIGGIAHFFNALLTFVVRHHPCFWMTSIDLPAVASYYKEFIHYLPLEVYLALQLVFGTAHAAFTVAGIMHLQNVNSPIHLSSESDHEYPHHHHLNGTDSTFKPLIPPPGQKETKNLAAIALGLSLLASIPLNLLLK